MVELGVADCASNTERNRDTTHTRAKTVKYRMTAPGCIKDWWCYATGSRQCVNSSCIAYGLDEIGESTFVNCFCLFGEISRTKSCGHTSIATKRADDGRGAPVYGRLAIRRFRS